jgi:hypothetical protein
MGGSALLIVQRGASRASARVAAACVSSEAPNNVEAMR